MYHSSQHQGTQQVHTCQSAGQPLHRSVGSAKRNGFFEGSLYTLQSLLLLMLLPLLARRKQILCNVEQQQEEEQSFKVTA